LVFDANVKAYEAGLYTETLKTEFSFGLTILRLSTTPLRVV
jgi:hypothetical protein